MTSFQVFFNKIIDWLDHNHSLILLQELYRPLVDSHETNPDSKCLWKGYLTVILPPAYSQQFVHNHFLREHLLQRLLGLSQYGLERRANHLIEQSFLRFLSHQDRRDLSDRLISFYSQLNNWVTGIWHEKIISNRFACLEDLVNEFKFPDKWSCASFLTNCGYRVPRSTAAFNAWLKWSGEPRQSDEYWTWLELLQELDSSNDSVFINDFKLDCVFNPVGNDLLPTLCMQSSDCWICSIQETCAHFDWILSQDFKVELENHIRTGNMQEIETEILIQFLAGDRWQNTRNQLFLVENFPDLSSKTAADYPKESKEEKLFIFLKGLNELSERLHQSSTLAPGVSIRGSVDIYEYVKPNVRGKRQELFFTLILDNKHRVIRLELITKGTLNQSLVHPREVFAPALQLRAAAVALIHNHPSGDSKPSQQDIQITNRLREVGDLVGIKVLDHLIVGNNSYFSFTDENLLS